jgi:hypothetical protein
MVTVIFIKQQYKQGLASLTIQDPNPKPASIVPVFILEHVLLHPKKEFGYAILISMKGKTRSPVLYPRAWTVYGFHGFWQLGFRA